MKKFIFKLRTRMIQVGDNFGRKEPCPICQEGNNNQQHLLECSYLNIRNSDSVSDESYDKSYNDIYEENAEEVIKISEVLYKLYRKREVILEERASNQAIN